MNNQQVILARCDASGSLGFGHVIRCLALAEELRDSHNCRVIFGMRGDADGQAPVREKGYGICTIPGAADQGDYGDWLAETARDCDARVLLLDVRDDLPRWSVEKLRDQGMLIVTVDDPSERRLTADLAFYPPVPQVKRMDWSGFRGQLFVGWEWVILRREFARRPVKIPNPRPVVLVTMGGSDPAGLTLKAIQALAIVNADFEVIVVLGPGFSHREALRKLLQPLQRSYQMLENVQDMAGLMARADLAVASFGVTAYELAAMCVPAVYFCLTDDHATSAAVFVEAGLAVSLGMYEHVNDVNLSQAVESILQDEHRQTDMTRHPCCRLASGGTVNVSEKIMEAVYA